MSYDYYLTVDLHNALRTTFYKLLAQLGLVSAPKNCTFFPFMTISCLVFSVWKGKMKRAVFLFFLQIINFLSGIFVVVIVVGVCACLQVCEQLN